MQEHLKRDYYYCDNNANDLDDGWGSIFIETDCMAKSLLRFCFHLLFLNSSFLLNYFNWFMLMFLNFLLFHESGSLTTSSFHIYFLYIRFSRKLWLLLFFNNLNPFLLDSRDGNNEIINQKIINFIIFNFCVQLIIAIWIHLWIYFY